MNLPKPDNQLEPEYIIDEKRGLVVNKRNMDTFQNFIYTRGEYKSYRPDLNDFDYTVFKTKWFLAEGYLSTLKQKLNMELTRLSMQTSFSFRKEKLRMFEDQILNLSQPHIKGCRFHADRNWQEASILSNYCDQLFQKIKKYGLHLPAFDPEDMNFNKNEYQQSLTDRFVREMRKTDKVQ